MAAITKTTLFSDADIEIIEFLRDNLADPISRDKARERFVTNHLAFTSADTGFVGYPYVYCEPATFVQTDEPNDHTLAEITWTKNIVVFATSVPNLNTISDSIFSVLNSVTNRETLWGKNIRNMQFNSVDTGEELIEGERIFRRSLNVTFKTRILI